MLYNDCHCCKGRNNHMRKKVSTYNFIGIKYAKCLTKNHRYVEVKLELNLLYSMQSQDNKTK